LIPQDFTLVGCVRGGLTTFAVRLFMSNQFVLPAQAIQEKIYRIRGNKVMLSHDLASLYDVEPRALIQAVKRNLERFPDDFMFQLSADEFRLLRSQVVILEVGRGRHPKHPPYAFTEQGVAMLQLIGPDTVSPKRRIGFHADRK